MKDINMIPNKDRSVNVYIDGELQRNVIDTQLWFDGQGRTMKFRIETHADGHMYARVFTDFTLRYGDRPCAAPEDCPHVHEFSASLNFGGTPDERIREAWGYNRTKKTPDPGNTYSVRVPLNLYDAVFSSPQPISNTTFILMDQLRQRDAKGREKYGTTLDRKDLSLVDWLQHQTEELLDGAGYAQAAKREAERLLRIEKAARLVWIAMQGVDCSSEGVKALNDLRLALRP